VCVFVCVCLCVCVCVFVCVCERERELCVRESNLRVSARDIPLQLGPNSHTGDTRRNGAKRCVKRHVHDHIAEIEALDTEHIVP